MGAITAPDPNATNDQVLNELKKVATEKGDGRFSVMIRRKLAPSLGSDLMARFDAISYVHLNDFEIWMAQLHDGGMGFYTLSVSHPEVEGLVGGGFLQCRGPTDGGVKPFNFGVLQSPHWRGPTKLVHPPPRLESVPGLPPMSESANPSSRIGTQPQHGGGAYVPQAGTQQWRGPQGNDQYFADRERDLQRREIEMINHRHAMEMNQVTSVVKELQRDIQVMRTQPAAAPKGIDIDKVFVGIAGLVGAAVPLVSKISEGRKEEAAIRREESKALAAAIKESSDRSAQMVKEALDKMSHNNGSGVQQQFLDMTSSVGKMIGNVTQSLVNQTTAMMELQQAQGSEPAWATSLRVVAEPVGKAIAAKILAGSPPQQGTQGNQQTQQQQQQLEQAKAEVLGQTMQKLLEMIKSHTPFPQMTDVMFSALADREVLLEVQKFQGKLDLLIKHHLGAWVNVPANANYLSQLIEYATAEGVRRGIFNPEPGTQQTQQQQAPQQQQNAQPQQRQPPPQQPSQQQRVVTPEVMPANGTQAQPERHQAQMPPDRASGANPELFDPSAP